MAIDVLIIRQFKKDFIHEAHNYNAKMRALATVQPGYISGRSLFITDDPNKCVVISTWDSPATWQDWYKSDIRKDYYKKMRLALDTSEKIELFSSAIATTSQ